MIDTLPTFRETCYGYISESRDGRHAYLLYHNGIDIAVNYYGESAPHGVEIAQVADIERAPAAARQHYRQLQSK